MGTNGYVVTINNMFGEIDTGDLTVCSIASFAAVAYAAGHKEIVTDEALDGWHLTECRVTDHSTP